MASGEVIKIHGYRQEGTLWLRVLTYVVRREGREMNEMCAQVQKQNFHSSGKGAEDQARERLDQGPKYRDPSTEWGSRSTDWLLVHLITCYA